MKNEFLKRALKMPFAGLMGALVFLCFFAFGSKGFISLFYLVKEKHFLQSEISSLSKDNQSLYLDIEKQKQDFGYYEKIARNKLMLAKQGEFIYRFETE